MHFQHRFRLLPRSITRRFARRARDCGRPRTARRRPTSSSCHSCVCCDSPLLYPSCSSSCSYLLLLLDSPQLLLLHFTCSNNCSARSYFSYSAFDLISFHSSKSPNRCGWCFCLRDCLNCGWFCCCCCCCASFSFVKALFVFDDIVASSLLEDDDFALKLGSESKNSPGPSTLTLLNGDEEVLFERTPLDRRLFPRVGGASSSSSSFLLSTEISRKCDGLRTSSILCCCCFSISVVALLAAGFFLALCRW